MQASKRISSQAASSTSQAEIPPVDADNTELLAQVRAELVGDARLDQMARDSGADALDRGVLLGQPQSCGTLAAARELGRRGITVWTVGTPRMNLTSSSRYVSSHLPGPSQHQTTDYIDGLARIGAARPGTVLYPTSDSCAWVQSLHAGRLQQHFHTYSPTIAAIERVLDKRRLYEACEAAGIDVPVTHFAESSQEVELVARHARFPLLLKQRTQILSRSGTKGVVVRDGSELKRAYEQFIARNPHAPQLRERIPYASWPMMQEFHPNAYAGSYLISGFIDRSHREIAALAAVKVLQYPRTLGIALCMEEAPLDAELLERIRTLCRVTGFFGVFQIEFLMEGPRRLLIDFNPRYYHYMGFDIARGLSLPWLVQLAATGHTAALTRELARIRSAASIRGLSFTYKMQLSQMLWAQRLFGTMSAGEAKRWHQWVRERRDSLVDAVSDPSDRWPGVVARATSWWARIRHPRAFIRQVALDA